MIIIIQGPPASGKTTLAKKISKEFSLPHINRDNIQEWLADVNDSKDESIQRFCASAVYKLTFDLAGELAKGSGSFIIEGCFNPEGGAERMKEKLTNSSHQVFEIFLKARPDVLVQHYLSRAGSTERHDAHGDESK